MSVTDVGQPTMPVGLRAMTVEDVPVCAGMVCASVLGDRYGFRQEPLEKTLRSALDSGSLMTVAELEGQVVGFTWVDPRGAFSSAPYLRLIAVSGAARGGGVGAALMDHFEQSTRDIGRDWVLLVSDFNTAAQGFYERLGYRKTGMLPDFARPGIAEIIMVKHRSQCA